MTRNRLDWLLFWTLVAFAVGVLVKTIWEVWL